MVLFHLGSWQPEGCCLPVGQFLDLDIGAGLVLGVENRLKYPPPVRYPFIILYIGLDPLSSEAWVGLSPSLGFLCFPGGVAAGF